MTKISVVLTEGFADWEVAHVLATMRTYYGADVMIATPDGRPVTSSGGLKVVADGALMDIGLDTTDVLLVCGGPVWSTPDAPDLSDLLARVAKYEIVIAGICGAVRPLAASGLLNTVAHTANSREEIGNLPGYEGQGHFREGPAAVSEGRIITAAGTSPVSFMAEIARSLGHGGANLDFYLGMLGAEHRAVA